MDHVPDDDGLLSWQDAGYRRPLDYSSANIFLKATHSWASPLLIKGKAGKLGISDAGHLLSKRDRIRSLVATFTEKYDDEMSKAKRITSRNAFMRAILRCHGQEMTLHSFWTVFESVFRLASPVALRFLVQWLKDYEDPDKDTDEGEGWLWASLLCVAGFALAASHHQLFWCGMRLGFGMKQQARFPRSIL
jgi:hypothetical protein